ncbi:MAG: hypothetical protein ACOC38_07810 [Promethearchaeia archaeon]
MEVNQIPDEWKLELCGEIFTSYDEYRKHLKKEHPKLGKEVK